MSESSVAQPRATPTVDDVQYHALRVKALARELWGFVDAKEPEKRVERWAPGYDAWWEEWNERCALVEMMQQCILEHLEQIEGEVLSLRDRAEVAS